MNIVDTKALRKRVRDFLGELHTVSGETVIDIHYHDEKLVAAYIAIVDGKECLVEASFILSSVQW